MLLGLVSEGHHHYRHFLPPQRHCLQELPALTQVSRRGRGNTEIVPTAPAGSSLLWETMPVPLLPSTSPLPSPAKQLWNLLPYLNQIRKKPRKHNKNPQRGQEVGEGEVVKTHCVASWLLLSEWACTPFKNSIVPGGRLKHIPPKTVCQRNTTPCRHLQCPLSSTVGQKNLRQQHGTWTSMAQALVSLSREGGQAQRKTQ